MVANMGVVCLGSAYMAVWVAGGKGELLSSTQQNGLVESVKYLYASIFHTVRLRFALVECWIGMISCWKYPLSCLSL